MGSIEKSSLISLAERDATTAKSRDLKGVRAGPEVGSTGLEVFGGIITGDLAEHNKAWQGAELYKTVDRMRRGDSTVAATWLSIVLPILSTEVHIEAKKGLKMEKPDPIVEEAAEFVHENIFGNFRFLERSWQSLLREMLLYLPYGHYVFEKVWGEISDGFYAGATGLRKLAPRHPSTIQQWLFDDNGELSVLVQVAAPKYEEVPLKVDKLVTLVNQSEAGNPLGMSIFRPAYKHWRYKDGFYAVQAIAIERQGAGVPFAKYPAGTDPSEVDKAEEMLQNVQAHEQSYFTYAEDWEVGFMDMGSQSTLDPATAIAHHDLMIPKSVLASFMNLPQDGKGSFALSSDMTGFFNDSLQDAASYIAGVFNHQIIPQLVESNYPGIPSYPQLRFDRIGYLSVDRVLDTVIKAVSEGAVTPDIALENRIRNLLNFPPVSEEDFEENKEEPELEPGSDGSFSKSKGTGDSK